MKVTIRYLIPQYHSAETPTTPACTFHNNPLNSCTIGLRTIPPPRFLFRSSSSTIPPPQILLYNFSSTIFPPQSLLHDFASTSPRTISPPHFLLYNFHYILHTPILLLQEVWSSHSYSWARKQRAQQFGRVMPQWHHASCVFHRDDEIKSLDEVDGLEDLRAADLQHHRKYIEGTLRASDGEVDQGKSVAPIPATGGSGDNSGEYEIENAKSSRSSRTRFFLHTSSCELPRFKRWFTKSDEASITLHIFQLTSGCIAGHHYVRRNSPHPRSQCHCSCMIATSYPVACTNSESGQGTVALEFLKQVPQLDFIIAPISGGGLISGITIAAKALKPSIQIIAAEPLGADDAAQSKTAGHVIPMLHPNTIADGLRASLGDLTWPVVRDLVSEAITADDKDIIEAAKLCFEVLKLSVEPSGAIGLAVLLSRKSSDFQGKNVGVVLSGGNVDLSPLWAAWKQKS